MSKASLDGQEVDQLELGGLRLKDSIRLLALGA
jgi:hypothetical protein